MRQGWHGIPYWAPGWRTVAVAAVLLLAFALLARRTRRPRLRAAGSFARELATVAALFAVWQVAGRLAIHRASGAIDHGRAVWHLERLLHLPSEATLQHVAAAHPGLAQALNGYYAVAHLTGMGLFLLWLIARHREHFPWVRDALVGLTGICLLIEMVPVAPPRLVPAVPLIDLPAAYHQSVYGPTGAGGLADQVAAMPSLHVGWSMLVAVAAVRAGRGRWRWVMLAHPVVTVVAVVATGNHYWLDGVAATAILAVVLAVLHALWPAREVAASAYQPRHQTRALDVLGHGR